MVKVQSVILISPTSIPADSRAAEVFIAWRQAGGKINELIERSLEAFGQTAEYRERVEAKKK